MWFIVKESVLHYKGQQGKLSVLGSPGAKTNDKLKLTGSLKH